jgi:hypothetical protein
MGRGLADALSALQRRPLRLSFVGAATLALLDPLDHEEEAALDHGTAAVDARRGGEEAGRRQEGGALEETGPGRELGGGAMLSRAEVARWLAVHAGIQTSADGKLIHGLFTCVPQRGRSGPCGLGVVTGIYLWRTPPVVSQTLRMGGGAVHAGHATGCTTNNAVVGSVAGCWSGCWTGGRSMGLTTGATTVVRVTMRSHPRRGPSAGSFSAAAAAAAVGGLGASADPRAARTPALRSGPGLRPGRRRWLQRRRQPGRAAAVAAAAAALPW